MKKFLLLASTLGFGIAFGQVTVDFETADTGYTLSASEGSSGSSIDIFNRSNPDIGGNSTFIFAVEDLTLSNPTLTIDQIDVSGESSFTFSIDLLTPTTEQWDSTDELLITYSLDGGSTQNLMWIQHVNDGGTSNQPAALDLAFDGNGDAGQELPAIVDGRGLGVSSNFETFTSSAIPLSSNTTLDIVLQFNNLTSTGEGIYIDNVGISAGVFASESLESVGFDESTSSETETNSSFATTIPVTLTNYGGSQVDLSVTISGGTAEAGDYALNTTSLSFTSSTTQNISIDINPDAGFINETIEITIAETSSTGITISQAVHTITVTDDETPNLVINEFQADPDASNGDANNDGLVSTTEDEFVEIVNTGGSNLDISNWVLSDAGSDTHTFADPTVLAPGQAVVVFGGGSPTGSFGGALVQVASGLSLNNGGDNIILKTDSGDEILNISYSSTEGNANQSYTLDADLIGSFTQHSSASGSGGALFSPGTKIDGSVFVSTASIIWDGSESNNWNNPDNWDGGVIPSSNDNVVIADVANDPILSSGDHAAANNLTINSGAVLSVDSGGSLAIFGSVTNNGTCYFEKAFGDNGYSIIGSPVSDETIDALGTDHFYSNTNGSGFSSNLKNSTSVMTPGVGYFAAYDGASQYPVFEGTPNTGDITYTPVTSSGFELIANPYTAAISTTKFLSDNTSVITGGVYFWDDGGSNVGGNRGGDYIAVTAVGAASAVQPDGSDDGVGGTKGNSRAENGYIPSAQGVFVEVTATSNITFSQSQQVIVPGSNDDSNYYRESGFQKVKLAISGNGLYNEVLIGLNESATYGVDRLLDAKKFVSGNALSLYSLIEDEKYVIQGLPLARTEAVNVALGFDLTESGTFEMSLIDFENIPAEMTVTLVDHLTGISYDLRATESFIFTSQEVENDQRFELQFSPTEVLSVEGPSKLISIFGNTSQMTIKSGLEGLQQVVIYSLDGKISFNENVDFSTKNVTINTDLIRNQAYVLIVGEESLKFIIK